MGLIPPPAPLTVAEFKRAYSQLSSTQKEMIRKEPRKILGLDNKLMKWAGGRT